MIYFYRENIEIEKSSFSNEVVDSNSEDSTGTATEH